jgi:alpha-aminoadipate carrier protein LysW
MPKALCPECEADVHVDADADKGDIIACEECGVDLELVGLDPYELDLVDEEDYDDYDDYDDDE